MTTVLIGGPAVQSFPKGEQPGKLQALAQAVQRRAFQEGLDVQVHWNEAQSRSISGRGDGLVIQRCEELMREELGNLD